MATDGVCCDCGASDPEGSEVCPTREDGTHCEHWWDGERTDVEG